MKITRERKIIGGILAIALAGFAFDRVSGSQAPQTDANSSDSLLVSTSSHKSATISNADINEASLADRFAQLASDTQLPDAAHLRDVFSARSVTDGASRGVSLSDSAFAQSHHLTAVTTSAQGGGAMVDGKMLHLGATIDGFKLVAVTRQSATFDSGHGQRVQLRINNAVANGQ